MPSPADRARPCVGCLDSRDCWVCSGTGFVHPIGRRGECARCAGSGTCHLCEDPADEPAVVGVPQQRAAEVARTPV